MTRNSIIAVALFASACGSSSAMSNGSATEEQYSQVAQSIAGATAASGELGAVAIANKLALGIVPIGLTADGLGHFHGDYFGLHYLLTVDCFDVQGQALAACGPTTSTANISTTWSGMLDLPRLAIDAQRTGTWTLSNLQTPTTTVVGDSHFAISSQFASASDQNHKTLSATIDATYHDVLVNNSTLAFVGGDAAYAVTASSTHTTPGMDDTDSFAVDATLTFNADGTATLVLDGNHRYGVDVRAGLVHALDGSEH